MTCLICPPPSKEYSKFHSGVEDDTAEGNLNLTPFSISTLKVQQPLFFVLLFNQQLSSSVEWDWDTIATPMSQQQLHGYLTEDKLPWLLASLASEPNTLKYMTRKGIHLFSIVSSLNAFFSSTFNSNFSTSEEKEKSPKILANVNLQQEKKH